MNVTRKNKKRALLTGGAEGVRRRMANGESTLRIRGDLAAVQRRRQQTATPPAQRVPSTRKRLCAQCGHYRSALEFVEIRNAAVVARYGCCVACRRRHPELDEKIERKSVRALPGGLPTLGKTRR